MPCSSKQQSPRVKRSEANLTDHCYNQLLNAVRSLGPLFPSGHSYLAVMRWLLRNYFFRARTSAQAQEIEEQILRLELRHRKLLPTVKQLSPKEFLNHCWPTIKTVLRKGNPLSANNEPEN